MEGTQDLFRNSPSCGFISKCTCSQIAAVVLIAARRSRSSNKRLERIAKGHRLWHIVDKQDSLEEDWDEDWGRSAEQTAPVQSGAVEPLGQSGGGLKDLGVDLEVRLERRLLVCACLMAECCSQAATKLHYGMVIVIVNSNEELVCVNEYNETMVKNLDQMSPTDHFLFKLVDLGDPTYPGMRSSQSGLHAYI